MAATTPKTDDTPKAGKAKADGISVKDLADHLSTDARALRSFVRRTGRAVGKGERYNWPSLKSPEVRKIEADWTTAQAKADAEAKDDPKPWLVLRALGDDRCIDLGVHYLSSDPTEVADDFRFEFDNHNPTGDRSRLYPVAGEPVAAFDR